MWSDGSGVRCKRAACVVGEVRCKASCCSSDYVKGEKRENEEIRRERDKELRNYFVTKWSGSVRMKYAKELSRNNKGCAYRNLPCSLR